MEEIAGRDSISFLCDQVEINVRKIIMDYFLSAFRKEYVSKISKLHHVKLTGDRHVVVNP